MHREWSPPLRLLGWDKDRKYPEPKTLFDDFAGRSKAIADHDMGIDKTFTDLDAKFPQLLLINLDPDLFFQPSNHLDRRDAIGRLEKFFQLLLRGVT